MTGEEEVREWRASELARKTDRDRERNERECSLTQYAALQE